MQTETVSLQRISRIIGVSYVILIFLGIFSEAFVRSSLVSYSDASLTVDNILKSELLFRFGVVSDILVLFGDIIIAVLLYFLLKTCNAILALLAVAFRLIVVAISSVNVLNLLSVLILIGGGDYLDTFSVNQIESTLLFLFKWHSYSYDVALAVFSMHCFIIGALFIKYRVIPKLIGIAMLIAACCYFIFTFGRLLWPELTQNLYPLILLPPLLAELALALWLLIKGVYQPKSKLL
ncbi:MAG: DUF4386 domain-containing protein [Bacteroidota bacterium]